MMRWFNRGSGISSARVAVCAHYPWYYRWAMRGLFLAANLGLIWLAFQLGQNLAGSRQSEPAGEAPGLSETTTRLAEENAKLRDSAASFERRLEIEHATANDLARQVKSVALENAALKEDIAVFKALMSPGGKDASVHIDRFKVERDAMPGEYRYQFLLSQNGQRLREFQGNIRLVASLQHEGKRLEVPLQPENDKERDAHHLKFKFFQRVEGGFKVAPNAVLDSLQVRVFENGATEPKLTQTVNVS